MSKCLIVLDHSFRLNSLIMNLALKNYNQISIVYVSNWYYNNNARENYLKCNTSFHKKAINYFSYRLETELKCSLHILKSKNPHKDIKDFCKENNIDHILYDLPLFSDKLVFADCLNVLEVDSDSYIPECDKMTAKSRWMFWSRNKLNKSKIYIDLDENKPDFYIGLGVKHNVDLNLALQMKEEVKSTLAQISNKLKTYKSDRNSRDGSTRLSALLHHGVLDARAITQIVLNQAGSNIANDNIHVPFLRQLAFREIAIRKVRQKNINQFDNIKTIAKTLLDKSSYDNLLSNQFEACFTKDQLFSGNTGFEKLDQEINLCIKNRWMPNRARMWFAGECYWGLGGGLKSLENLVDFFDMFCDDAQSPNNIINCIECMRLKYGKVMRYNKKRTLRLLAGEEKI